MSEATFFTMEYPMLNEKVCYKNFANGLTAYVIEKPGFASTYACIGTNFGSVHREFKTDRNITVPDGLAHFLEHKMFESDEGNALQLFSDLGASPNAYTSFNKTVYLFSCTSNLHLCLEMLLKLISTPLFTEENIAKEQGIIGQEIDMCNDDPDRRVYFNLLKAMYKNHPVRIDIAGTKESIAEIDKETLQMCYDLFYSPDKLQMVVVGDVDAAEVFDTVEKFYLDRENIKNNNRTVKMIAPKESKDVAENYVSERMDVFKTKLLVGFKDHPNEFVGATAIQREIAIEIMLDCIFGKSSDWYQKAYGKHLINGTFETEYDMSDNYAYAVLGGDTDYPDELVENLKETIKTVIETGISEDAFERAKKARKGDFIMSLDSPKGVGSAFIGYLFRGILLFDYVDIYDRISFDFAHKCFVEVFDERYMSVSIIDNK